MQDDPKYLVEPKFHIFPDSIPTEDDVDADGDVILYRKFGECRWGFSTPKYLNNGDIWVPGSYWVKYETTEKKCWDSGSQPHRKNLHPIGEPPPNLIKRAWELTEIDPQWNDADRRLPPPKTIIMGNNEDGNLVVRKKIYCNNCGKSCEFPHGDTPGYYGLLNYTHFGGYGSEYHSGLEDLTRYTFSVCDPCIKKFMDGFVRPAVRSDYNINTGEPDWIDDKIVVDPDFEK